ncbi:hypothetical protein [Legionella pneumophila]|uniref:hypothetical protein n=1 Tax=Legionella pneumophila TaxID=446 RepID=UPI000ACC55EC|nr:hypothetical protein [Legionella pneumophila]
MVALVEFAEPHYKGKKNRVAISGLIEGLSRMMRKYQVRFLWELRSAMGAAYQADIKPTKQSLGMMKAENNIPNRQGKIIKQNNGQSLWVARNMEEKSWA